MSGQGGDKSFVVVDGQQPLHGNAVDDMPNQSKPEPQSCAKKSKLDAALMRYDRVYCTGVKVMLMFSTLKGKVLAVVVRGRPGIKFFRKIYLDNSPYPFYPRDTNFTLNKSCLNGDDLRRKQTVCSNDAYLQFLQSCQLNLRYFVRV